MARDLGEAFSNIGAGLMARAEKERERKLLEEERKRLKEEEEAAWERKQQFLARLKQQEAEFAASQPVVANVAGRGLLQYSKGEDGQYVAQPIPGGEAAPRQGRTFIRSVGGRELLFDEAGVQLKDLGPSTSRQGSPAREERASYWQKLMIDEQAKQVGIQSTIAQLEEQLATTKGGSSVKEEIRAKIADQKGRLKQTELKLKEYGATAERLGGGLMSDEEELPPPEAGVSSEPTPRAAVNPAPTARNQLGAEVAAVRAETKQDPAVEAAYNIALDRIRSQKEKLEAGDYTRALEWAKKNRDRVAGQLGIKE